MKKILLTIIVTAFGLSSVSAQFEDILWKKVGEESFGKASGGVAGYYMSATSTTPTYSNNYTLKGDTVSFTDPNNLLCNQSLVGKYKITTVNDVLTYNVVSDPCILRTAQLDKTQWKKYIPLGIEENVAGSVFRFYPNPAKEKLNVELASGDGQFMLYDAKGILVLDKILSEKSTNISIIHLEKGFYQARLLTDGKIIRTGLVITE